MKSTFRKLAHSIIRYSFDLAVFSIKKVSRMKKYDERLEELRHFNPGSLGKEIADCLDKDGLSLVPKFESHDLKHVVLDYKMNPEGEIRLQAFMIGNGNISIPSIAILVFGMLLLPSKWSVFYADFQKGRKTIAISDWSIEKYAPLNLDYLQHQIAQPISQPKPFITMNSLTKIGAFTAIFTGVGGMLYCLPFLFSSNIADLVGAGFPFIGGAILTTGGLIALSNTSRRVTSV